MRSQSHLPEHVSSPTPQDYQCHLPSPLPMENSCFSQPCCSMPSISFFSPLILKLDANKSNSRVALHQTNPITSHYCHSNHSTPQHPVWSRRQRSHCIRLPLMPVIFTGVFWFVCKVWRILNSGYPKTRLILNLLLHLSRLEYSNCLQGFINNGFRKSLIRIIHILILLHLKLFVYMSKFIQLFDRFTFVSYFVCKHPRTLGMSGFPLFPSLCPNYLSFLLRICTNYFSFIFVSVWYRHEAS